MAYIKRSGVESGQPATTGAGGTLGSGETAALGKGGSSANQSPTGFSNIQDFLKANQGQSQIANQVEQKGNEALQKQVGQFESNKGQLSAVPTATEYTPESMQNALQANEYDTMRAGYNQSYNPQSQEQIQGQLSQGVSNPFANMKSGDFGSIMNFFGQSQPTSSQYTRGMQKQDELLLRGKPGAVENIPTNLQSGYEQQVANPLAQTAQQRAQQEAQAGQQIGQAKQGWQSGIKDWLGQQNTALQSKLGEQQQQYDYTPQMTNEDFKTAVKGIYGNDIFNIPVDVHGEQRAFGSLLGGYDPYDYYSKTALGTTPDINTAAADLNNFDINDYNALSGLQGGTQIASTPFEAPQWGWNEDSLKGLIEGLKDQYGVDSGRAPSIYQPTGTPTGGVTIGQDLTQLNNKRIGA